MLYFTDPERLNKKEGSRRCHVDLSGKGKENRFCVCTGGRLQWEQKGSVGK